MICVLLGEFNVYHTHLDIQRLQVRKTARYARCRWRILQIEQSNKCFYPTRTAITLSWSLFELQPAIRTLSRRLVDGVQMFHLQKTAQKQKKHGKRSFESFVKSIRIISDTPGIAMILHESPWYSMGFFMIFHVFLHFLTRFWLSSGHQPFTRGRHRALQSCFQDGLGLAMLHLKMMQLVMKHRL